MEKLEIKAIVEALESTAREMRSLKEQAHRVMAFTTIKSLIEELRGAAEGHLGEANINGILTEVDVHLRGLAGLHPTYKLDDQAHFEHAMNSISKLSYHTAFAL